MFALSDTTFSVADSSFNGNQALGGGGVFFEDGSAISTGVGNSFLHNAAAFAADSHVATSPASLQLTSHPSGTQSAGQPLSPLFRVQLLDSNGNIVTASPSPIAVSASLSQSDISNYGLQLSGTVCLRFSWVDSYFVFARCRHSASSPTARSRLAAAAVIWFSLAQAEALIQSRSKRQ